MKNKVIPFNTDADGNARCIKAGYYKMGFANFVCHPNDGFTATAIIEVEDEQDDDVILVVNPDGSILGRRPFNGGTIALQRLQFSSNLGIAFCISAERVPQVIIYEDEQDEESYGRCSP